LKQVVRRVDARKWFAICLKTRERRYILKKNVFMTWNIASVINGI